MQELAFVHIPAAKRCFRKVEGWFGHKKSGNIENEY
jgi:hypothetical protein